MFESKLDFISCYPSLTGKCDGKETVEPGSGEAGCGEATHNLEETNLHGGSQEVIR